MSDLFVSYKAEDRRRVRPLVEALEAEGFSVWWDAHLGGGSAWRQTIEAELNAAACVIVVWSKRSTGADGAFVQDEAARAQRRHVYLPVTIDKVEPPLGFGETQALPLRAWKGDRSDPAYRAVLHSVTSMVRRKGPPLPSERARIGRRGLIAACVGGAAVALTGGWFAVRGGSHARESTIAVLPFENLSGDPSQAYFSDGTAEELRSALSRIPQLRVVARTSSEMVRNEDAKTAARKLGVANILTGSVRRSSGVIRVTTQLVDGSTGMELWSASYDEPAGDALKIQSDIAKKVVRAMDLRLGGVSKLALGLGETSNPEAHDAYLKAVSVFLAGNNVRNLRQSLELLNSAIGLDPQYAKAWAEKAIVVTSLTSAFGLPSDIGFSEAEGAAKTAIRLAPRLSLAHLALAKALLGRVELPGARQEFERASETGANSSEFLTEYASFLTQMGLTGKALQLVRKAEVIDPLNLRTREAEAVTLFIGRHYPEALRLALDVLSKSPDRLVMRIMVGDIYNFTGKADLARQQYAMVPDDNVFRLRSEAAFAWRAGDKALSDRDLNRLTTLYGRSANVEIADVHAQRGEKDQAIAALERALAVREYRIGWILTDPLLDPLRHDPRFTMIVRQLNIPAIA